MSKIVIIAIITVIVGLPILLKDHSTTKGSSDLPTLIIITPHNEQIRYEITNAYKKYRAQENLPKITIDWRTSGSAGDWQRQIVQEYTNAYSRDQLDQGIGKDIFFGGGDYIHNKLAKGFNVRQKQIRILDPIDISDEKLKQLFPVNKIGNNNLYNPQKLWVGVVLSSFGIVYNKDVVKALKTHPPKTWSDIASPKYQNWIALADPALSGSTNATYNTILQRLGWTQGWITLQNMMANARYFTASSTKIPISVTNANAAAGMCIDFYGRSQESSTPNQRIAFVAPHKETNITPDPVAILRGAPHKKTAQHFIAWLLSKNGQLLWQKKLNTPNAPIKFQLRRLPIRKDLYTDQIDWTDPINPFDTANPLPPNAGNFFQIIPHLAHAMAIDNHENIKAAWNTIQKQKDPHLKNKMLRIFHQLPEDLTLNWDTPDLQKDWHQILQTPTHNKHKIVTQKIVQFYAKLNQNNSNRAKMTQNRKKWTHFYIQNYNKIIKLAHNNS